MIGSISLDGSDWDFKPFYGMDWLWRNAHKPDTRDTRGWRRGGTVPGSVVYDLWRCGEIADPYVERNSLLAEWVPQRTWLYRKRFTVPADVSRRRVTLRFEGVDYAAQFFLNGHKVGEHASMYTPAVFDVGDRLNYGEENLLVVVLEAAPAEQPQVGRTSLVRTHKSRMTYWWDFCPRMVHLGIWDRVALDVTGPARIADVWVRTRLNSAYTRADVTVQVTLDRDIPAAVEIALYRAGTGSAAQAEIARQRIEASRGGATFTLDNPALWWPNGCGGQPLYEARVTVFDPVSGAASDTRAVTFGIREIVFVPNDTPDDTALPYTPRVNGRKIYIQGWNWVPLDVLYGVERPDKLDHLLALAQQAHVNMLRVWGGGLIEKDAFYDRCDRLGILVWQEFILSSSGIDNVPSTDPGYMALLESEARRIIPRRRCHPALAIWGGGNELQGGPEQPLDDSHPVLGMLHGVVKGLDPDRMWLPTSPSGRTFSNSLEMIARDPLGQHDVHGPWEHQGLTRQYTLYNQATSLLHSEFGAEGITNLPTLRATVSEGHRWPVTLDDPVWFHRGAWWVKETQWRESLGEVDTLEKLVWGTQYLQAEGVRYAIEANRRRQWHNSGSLPWQFNEPYPMAACTSAVDYYGHPKPLYYAVARAYAPELVGAGFPTQSWHEHTSFTADLWCANANPDPAVRTLRARLVGLDGTLYAEHTADLVLAPGAITGAGTLARDLDGVPDLFFLDLVLWNNARQPVARQRTLFTRQPTLASALARPPAAIAVLDLDRAAGPDTWRLEMRNPGRQAALFVWLEDARARGSGGWPVVNDNYFCLLPGEARSIQVGWRGVPVGERAIALSGWNVEPLTIR